MVVFIKRVYKPKHATMCVLHARKDVELLKYLLKVNGCFVSSFCQKGASLRGMPRENCAYNDTCRSFIESLNLSGKALLYECRVGPC